MTSTAPYRNGLGQRNAPAAFSGTAKLKVASHSRPTARHVAMASGAPYPTHPGTSVVPQAAGRAGGSGSNKSRSFSVMQSAMNIPGLASALNFIGVNGNTTNGSSSAAVGSGVSAGTGSSTAVAAGMGDAAGLASEQTPTAAVVSDGLYDSTASAEQSSNGHSTGTNHPPQASSGDGSGAGATQANGHATGTLRTAEPAFALSAAAPAAAAASAAGVGGPLDALDPVGVRVENNIMPYNNSLSPSLAAQIRDIASTLRHINSLRVEYLERIAQQEMELGARNQTLRAKDDRIQAMELEAQEVRRSMAQLQKANEALEAEVRKLRSEAAAATAAAAAAAAALSAPPPPLPSPLAGSVAPPAAAPVATAASTLLPPSRPPPPPPAAPQPVTAAKAPAPAKAPAQAQAQAAVPATAPPPPPPPPTLPPRVPEIVLLYRSSWTDAYLHFNVEGRGWTAPPGHKMEHSGSKEYTIRVPGRSIEFVLTNGSGEWDSPGGGPGRNYRVDTPGEYRLHYGAVTQVKPWQP